MKSVRAIFLKFRGTNDKRWLWFRFCYCGAVGVVFVSFRDSSYVFGVVDSLVLFSFIRASKSISLIDVVNIPKSPAKSMRATLACLFTCVCVLRMYCRFLLREKRNPRKFIFQIYKTKNIHW